MKKRSVKFLSENATYDEMSSPVGTLTIITTPAGLHAVLWDIDRKNPKCEKIIDGLCPSKDETTILRTKEQLTEYFEGKRKLFDLPLVINGTEFQMQAWKQLLQIPYATTLTYAKQAGNIGDKNKARAIGHANGSNPISIIIPCHRVIGSNGKLVGFGGGLDRKVYLLNLEQQILKRTKESKC
ncbi:methylated-DNA--[protein]-cysteine S-methyltransferase [soil metagenome]